MVIIRRDFAYAKKKKKKKKRGIYCIKIIEKIYIQSNGSFTVLIIEK